MLREAEEEEESEEIVVLNPTSATRMGRPPQLPVPVIPITRKDDDAEHCNDNLERASVSSENSSASSSSSSSSSSSRTKKFVRSRLGTVLIYFSAATVAVMLTLAVPRTRLWDQGFESEGQTTATLNQECFVELMLAYGLTLLSLYAVQGSNPGYLDEKVVAEAFGHDVDDDGLLLSENGDHQFDNGDGGTVPPSSRGGGDVEMMHPTSTTRREVEQNGSSGHGAVVASGNRTALHRSPLMASCSDDDFGDDGDLEDDVKATVIPGHEHAAASSSPKESTENGRGGGRYYTKNRRKYCARCGFAPPLRSHHCRSCDRCVATFDHHCFFIGTCIGERNHCRFWWFLSFQFVGFCTCVSIVNSQQRLMPQTDGVGDGGNGVNLLIPLVSIMAKVYLYPLLFLACIMWIAHTWFALANVTSFECGKGPRHIDYLRGTKDCDLPFSRGLDANLRIFCCLRDRTWSIFVGDDGRNSWKPLLWKPPAKIERDSEDWWEHPWENKYYSCC